MAKANMPLQVLHAVRAILFVEMNDGFGVAVGAVLVTERLQFVTQNGHWL